MPYSRVYMCLHTKFQWIEANQIWDIEADRRMEWQKHRQMDIPLPTLLVGGDYKLRAGKDQTQDLRITNTTQFQLNHWGRLGFIESVHEK